MNKSKAPSSSDVYLEFTQMGKQMRVAAIDAKSGVEVVIITPLNTPRQQIEKLAIAKLKRRFEQLKNS